MVDRESADGIDCAGVAENDLIARYVAGRLEGDEAEAFEAHYFACRRCWEDLQRALEVRAAFAPDDSAETAPRATGSASPTRAFPRKRWARWGIPIAAAAAILAVVIWRGGSGPVPEGPGSALRGEAPALDLRGDVRADTVIAAWSSVPNADLYRLSLHTADGALLLQRETADTSIRVLRDSIPSEAGYWSVEALDALRKVVARSRLVPLTE